MSSIIHSIVEGIIAYHLRIQIVMLANKHQQQLDSPYQLQLNLRYFATMVKIPKYRNNFLRIPIKWSFGETFKQNVSLLIEVKIVNFCLIVSLEGQFYCKLLEIGIRSTTVSQAGGPAPAPPTPPDFRLILLHTKLGAANLCVSLLYRV